MARTIDQLWTLGSVRSYEEGHSQFQQKHQSSPPRSIDFLWKEYFRDPLQWRDNRDSKLSSAYPDFTHTFTMDSLRINDPHNPSWVLEELRKRGLSQDGKFCDDNEKAILSFIALLRTYAKSKDLYRGTKVHDDILKRGLLEQCSDALVTMYAKCGVLAKAKELLDMHKSKDAAPWNALIIGYAREGQSELALQAFEQMQHEGFSPNAATFVCVLKACASIGAIDKGEQIHDQIARQGLLKKNIVLGTALVDMYAKCGALAKAQRVLQELPSRNVITWSALITGYAQKGKGAQALDCFEQMQHEGLSPNAVTFACVLKACGSIGAADKGEQVHDEIRRQGLLGNDIVLGTALVDMYAKCGELAKAQQVLKELPCRNVTTWNALIAGYAQHGQGEEALNCYERLRREGVSPNAMTFSSILKACSSLGAADKGEQIHDQIARQGLLRNNIVLGSALVDMYAKCGALTKAEQVLAELPSRNVITWSALITGYAQQGQGEQALNCFERMQREGVSPDAVTFSCVINACSHLGLVDEGHAYFRQMSAKYGLEPDLKQYACMVDLFGRAGHLDRAVKVIQEMPCSDYSAVWSALLGACQKWGDVKVGRWAFEHAVQVDKCDAAAYVLMANIYSAAGMQEDAENIEAMRMENKAWRKAG